MDEKLPPYIVQGESARLFPVLSTTSKEGRTTSIVLACLTKIDELAKALLASADQRVGSRAKIECYTEIVPAKRPSEMKDRPDGLIVLRVGTREWRAFVETKIGNSELDADQIERYRNLARDNDVDCVVTISNQFATAPTVHPLEAVRKSRSKIPVIHWSWMHVLTTADLLISRNDVADNDQLLLLNELRRFLAHESAGVRGFDRMPREWTDLNKLISSGGVIPVKSQEAKAVLEAWHQETRDLSLILSRMTETNVQCHLLHPRSEDKSRRAVDAMMCILNLSVAAPAADLLFLSAMMKNSSEISDWIENLTGRPCLSLDLLWKPTRQVRGCVVYSDSEIQALNSRLQSDRRTYTTRGAPVSTQEAMRAEPYAFFCLNQTWHTTSRNDYSLQKLLNEQVKLAVGAYLRKGAPNNTARWYLTPNGVQVSQTLAEEISKQNLKTIVFMQTIPWAISAHNKVCKNVAGSGCVLTENERASYDAAKDEMGGADHLYLFIDEDANTLQSSSACHHGHLLSFERTLHESLFKRSDGLNVLVATSTLSQGMNLPGDVVVIGGDSRFDLDANRMARLEAHELLNAAGRAGRAGQRSHGLVIVVPSKVVEFNNENSTINRYWTELQGIFSQGDQCLTIEDPLEPLLDRIHDTSSAGDPMTEYLVGRLPLNDDQSITVDKTSEVVSRSFAAFKRQQGAMSESGVRAI